MVTGHIVQFSGGAGSFAAAVRVVERFGADAVVLLAADTRSEAPGWRRFMDDAAGYLGARLEMLDQGVDLWELAEQQRMIPNTRADFCSRMLKREPLRAWIDAHCEPGTTVHFGFDWTEQHRLDRARPFWEPWAVDAPLTWSPVVDKVEALEMIAAAGLVVPAAYDNGMPHNNCLKYGCVKGGHSYWAAVLRNYPDAFAASEAGERRISELVGYTVSILRDRTRGTTRPLPLSEFRRRSEAQPSLPFGADWGSCSCMEAL